MGIPDRLFNIAKSYLDTTRNRIDQLDATAQSELDQAVGASPTLPAWERAQNRINSVASRARSAEELRTVPADTTESVVPAAKPSSNALAAAYHVLDIPVGADLLSVQSAYQDIMKKADPNRFPNGSMEQLTAAEIVRKVNGAYMVLVNDLSTSKEDRFDRLEI